MRFAPETLFACLATGIAVESSWASFQAVPGSSPGPSPSATATPSPSPRYILIPYGFETAKDRSTVPLLRFQDETEVRSLEMNAAIARFFDKSDDKGNMLRGATPGGAPTLRDMAPYRPHVTPAISLSGVAAVAIREVKKQIDQRKGMPAANPSPTPSPSPQG